MCFCSESLFYLVFPYISLKAQTETAFGACGGKEGKPGLGVGWGPKGVLLGVMPSLSQVGVGSHCILCIYRENTFSSCTQSSCSLESPLLPLFSLLPSQLFLTVQSDNVKFIH